jgi:hypothetical protein
LEAETTITKLFNTEQDYMRYGARENVNKLYEKYGKTNNYNNIQGKKERKIIKQN